MGYEVVLGRQKLSAFSELGRSVYNNVGPTKEDHRPEIWRSSTEKGLAEVCGRSACRRDAERAFFRR